MLCWFDWFCPSAGDAPGSDGAGSLQKQMGNGAGLGGVGGWGWGICVCRARAVLAVGLGRDGSSAGPPAPRCAGGSALDGLEQGMSFPTSRFLSLSDEGGRAALAASQQLPR